MRYPKLNRLCADISSWKQTHIKRKVVNLQIECKWLLYWDLRAICKSYNAQRAAQVSRVMRRIYHWTSYFKIEDEAKKLERIIEKESSYNKVDCSLVIANLNSRVYIKTWQTAYIVSTYADKIVHHHLNSPKMYAKTAETGRKQGSYGYNNHLVLQCKFSHKNQLNKIVKRNNGSMSKLLRKKRCTHTYSIEKESI